MCLFWSQTKNEKSKSVRTGYLAVKREPDIYPVKQNKNIHALKRGTVPTANFKKKFGNRHTLTFISRTRSDQRIPSYCGQETLT